MNSRTNLTPALADVPTSEKKEDELQIDWVTVSTSEPEQEVTINWEEGTGKLFLPLVLALSDSQEK